MPDLHASFSGRRILVTGNTGFKGSWLTVWLHRLGGHVLGYSLDDRESGDLLRLPKLSQVFGDVRDFEKLKHAFQTCSPEIVFHLAAQPLVGYGYEHPRYTYEVNVLGTMNVLECIRHMQGGCAGIMVTSDKCYENTEGLWGYRETDPLGGHDPYSSSKACCEILVGSYRSAFFPLEGYRWHGKAIASARAGNVIGGGDWAKDRIIPDGIRELSAGRPVVLRNPEAVRPWQHVLEPLSGYLLLGASIMRAPARFSGAWNFGPEDGGHVSVETLVDKLIGLWGAGRWVHAAPGGAAGPEASVLRLDITKAKRELGWVPRWDLDAALRKTVDWYRAYDGTNRVALCESQIDEYTRGRPA